MTKVAPLPALLDGDPRRVLAGRGAVGHRGAFVLYWPQIQRRATDNAALSYAIAEANRRRLPLVVYEALRVDYPHASDRFHAFVLEGAAVEAKKYRDRGARYAFFLPKTKAEARGVGRQLARLADLVVTDAFPTFTIADHVAGLLKDPSAPIVVFDDTCVVPLALFPKEEYAARTIRPKVHRLLPEWLRPIEEPTVDAPPWRGELPFAETAIEELDVRRAIAHLPIDHEVPPVDESPGGSVEAQKRLDRFLARKLSSYPEDHNHPDRGATSRLSPYLHFGMIGARGVALAVRDAGGSDEGKAAFLEQLLVRRTLAFNFCSRNADHHGYDALPDWAKRTLAEHLRDRRGRTYSRAELEDARTEDPVWNAAQRELRATGVIHNYARMLWGKCVLAWKETPREAIADLVHLNDKWCLDGRDPNTYTNVLWCFGKHDRPWVKRPIFGTTRFMSTSAARKKLDLDDWLRRWS